MLPTKLIRYVGQLCKYAPLLAAGAETLKEEEAFYDLLGRVMSLPVAQEALVWAHVQQTLREVGGSEAWEWLEETLEAESSMAVWEVEGRAYPLEAVLFAVPVVYSVGATPKLLGHELPFSRLAETLTDAQLVYPEAKVALCNRLLSLDDLGARTPGEIERLTGHFCEQLLDENAEALQLPLDWALTPPTGATPNQGVQLFYLLGVAALPDSSLVFPDAAEGSVGQDEEGLSWEAVFSRLLGATYEIEKDPMVLGAPAGFHDALRMGAYAARGASLGQALHIASSNGLKEPRATLLPNFNSPATPGIALEFTSLRNKRLMLKHFWAQAYGETEDECLEMLGEQLRAYRIPVEPLFADFPDAGPMSLRLH